MRCKHSIFISFTFWCAIASHTSKGTWRKWKIFLIVRRMHSHVHSILIIEIAKRVWRDWKGWKMQLNVPLCMSRFRTSTHHVIRMKLVFFRYEGTQTRRVKTRQENGNWKEVEGVVAQGRTWNILLLNIVSYSDIIWIISRSGSIKQ